MDLISERLQIPVSIDNQSSPQQASPNITDAAGILIPAGWDSRGKILALRESFDFEAVCTAWENDIIETASDNVIQEQTQTSSELFQSMIDISATNAMSPILSSNVVKSAASRTEMQQFLAKQKEILDSKMAEYTDTQNQTGTQNEVNIAGIQLDGMDHVISRIRDNKTAVPITPDRRFDRSESNTPVSPPSDMKAQNEVLANFFQSLLDRRHSANSSPSQ